MVLTSRDASAVAHSGQSLRRGRRADWRRTPKSLTASVVDIDVVLTDIVFQRHDDGFESPGAHRLSGLADHALEGVVHSRALTGSDAAGPYLVYVSGYEDSDRMDRSEDFDQRSVCYVATDRRPDFAWRTNIYIERFVFRHLVELYASRRIDSARISILLKVLLDPSGAVEVPALAHPMLRTAGDRHRQHSRAHLMSVETSLGGPAALAHPAISSHSTPWGARLGRRQSVALRR